MGNGGGVLGGHGEPEVPVPGELNQSFPFFKKPNILRLPDERLFTQDVAAGAQCLGGKRQMLFVRGADIYDVWPLLGKKGPEVCVTPSGKAEEISKCLRRPVAACGRPAGEGDDLAAPLRVPFCVVFADAVDAGDDAHETGEEVDLSDGDGAGEDQQTQYADQGGGNASVDSPDDAGVVAVGEHAAQQATEQGRYCADG